MITYDKALNILAENIYDIKKNQRQNSLQRRNQTVDLYGYVIPARATKNEPSIHAFSVSQDMIYYSRFEFKVRLSKPKISGVIGGGDSSMSNWDAKGFVNNYMGKPIDMDGVPSEQPYQCVDVWKKALEVLGYPNPSRPLGGSGGACEIWYLRNSLGYADYFTFESTPQYGDFAIWNESLGGGYGHVAMVVGDGQYFGQNQPYPYCNTTSLTSSGILGYMRPKGNVKALLMNEKNSDSFRIEIEGIDLTPYFKAQFNGVWINSTGVYPNKGTSNYDVLKAVAYMSKEEQEKILSPGYKEIKIYTNGDYEVDIVMYLKYSHVNR